MYWDINKILPYQRTFNFINGPRSIGKTYTCLKWLIKQGLNGREFAYIVRTQDEKKQGVLKDALAKVLDEQYPDLEAAFSTEAGVVDGVTFCRCFALTEAVKLKRRSFPKVCWFIFDEYTIEDGTARYINGFQEPELFMNLYHTVDREEERVKCFFMGNNTSYFNPYHLYPVFGLPGNPGQVPESGIWKNAVSLLQLAAPSEELMKKRNGNRVIQAMVGSRYGEYAVAGKYRDDGYQPIRKLCGSDIYRCTIHTPDIICGCYTSAESGVMTFSDKADMKFPVRFSLVREGHKSGFPYIRPAYEPFRKMLTGCASYNQIFYTDMSVKAKFEAYLLKIL